MAQTMTLEQAKAAHADAVETNRRQGVVDYQSGEKQSSEVWEVTDGYKHLPTGKGHKTIRLGPGHRFHPTVGQVEQTRAGRGGLVGKARELTLSEYEHLRGRERSVRSTGADIGLRALNMAESTVKRAIEAGMTAEDFEGVEPAGQDGQYTFRQVDEMIRSSGN